MHRQLAIPDGDVLIHAGDIGVERNINRLVDFNDWLGELPHKHKIVIPGNHDVAIETSQLMAREILSNCHFLIDEEVVIEGIKFWGSPWQPEFCNWSWNLPRGKALEKVWSWIPDDTDVLITHGPPRGILDLVVVGALHEGCTDLRIRVFDVKPKVHIFGHIHEGYGQEEHEGIRFINASTCDFHYRPINPPVVVDI